MVWLIHPHLKTTSAALVIATLPMAYSHAQTPAVEPQEKALAEKLSESEARIRILQQRLERLERRLDSRSADETSAPSEVDTGSTAQQKAVQSAPRGRTQPASTTQPVATASAARPGTFEVDEDAAQRALERTLTETGALLLPPGKFSVTPSLSYTRSEQTGSSLLEGTDSAGDSFLALSNNRNRRNDFSAGAELKYGLPAEIQLEVDVPYNYTRSSTVSTVADAFEEENESNGGGIGDITIGIAKTLAREKGSFPDLIGRLTYNTGSGRTTDNQVILDGGYRQLGAEIVALKRQDPLAFFASASYGHVFEENGLKPGNVTALSLGTVLAASPATSLQFAFSQVHSQKLEVDNAKVAGSDQTYGVISIGASSVLSRNSMLQVTAGIGVGEDAPDYSFGIALPITFD